MMTDIMHHKISMYNKSLTVHTDLKNNVTYLWATPGSQQANAPLKPRRARFTRPRPLNVAKLIVIFLVFYYFVVHS